MIRSSHHRPIYREVVFHAFRTAWQEKRFWPISLLAGILVTAGSYDVMLNALAHITSQGPFLAVSTGSAFVQRLADSSTTGLEWFIGVAGGIEALLFLAILMIFFGGISCIAQGALVYAIGAHRRGERTKLKDAFRVGADAFWPIVAMNVMLIALVWILRFLVAFPLFLALDNTTTTTYLMYLASFIVFIPVAFCLAILQVFALNAMILQGANIGDAIRRGYVLLARNWVVVVEAALLQAVLSIGVWLAFLAAFMFVMIPIFAFIVTSALIQSIGLFTFSLVIGTLIFVCGAVVAAAFTVQLQYATWTHLYKALGEGGVVPKIHRVVRSLTGFFGIKK
ncbi:hypothetical protein KJ925_03805 [Patescibacteria group bacterium]|nr:hypothetical protein [Patescibacteria group bacterium]